MSMSLSSSTLALFQYLTAGFCFLLALDLRRKKAAASAGALALVMVALGIWALASGLETDFVERESKIFFAKMMHLGVQNVAPLMLLFAIQFGERKHWLKPGRLAMLWVIPVITTALVFTNEQHHLFWTAITPSPLIDRTDLVYAHGVAFWASLGYSYLLLVSASILTIRGFFTRKIRRKTSQLVLILLALAISWGANLAYVTGLVPVPGLDLTPFSFAITCALLSLVIYPLHIFDLMPVARSQLVDTMSDAVFVIDEYDRVLDTNPAGQNLTGKKASQLIAHPAADVFSAWPTLVQRLRNRPISHTDAFVIQDSRTCWYDVRITPLAVINQSEIGWLVVLRDISHSKQIEMELSILNKIITQIAASLEIHQVLYSLFQNLKEILPLDYYQAAMVDRLTSAIYFPAYTDETGFQTVDSIDDMPEKQPLLFELAQEIIYKEKTVRIGDLHETGWRSPAGAGEPDRPAPRSYLGAPMISHGVVSGGLVVMSKKPYAYSPQQVKLFETIAAQAAITLENTLLYKETHRLAILDPLTGIYNRRHLYELACAEFERCRRYRHPLSAIMMDIDQFKAVNDRHGHAAGDHVLRMLAKTCKDHLRKTDLIGRYGGEEFVVIMPETDEHRALDVAERLRRRIARMLITSADQNIAITVSLGVSTLNFSDTVMLSPQHGIENLIEQADKALYTAKETGRNQVAVHLVKQDI